MPGSEKMDETQTDRPINLGIYSRQDLGGISAAEIIAIALSLLWIAGVALFFLFAPSSNGQGGMTVDPPGLVMRLLAIFLPIAVIWVGALSVRSARIMREESARLQAAIDAMRHTYVTQAQSSILGTKPSVEKKLDQIAHATRQTETALATFTSSRDATPSAEKPAIAPAGSAGSGEAQPTLALGTTAEDIAVPVSVADFIRALNFPETAEDREGFNALRRALKDRSLARLIQAAQDVLTLLSQDGIYMDDLKPDRARPEVWRKFAQGERGRAVAPLGGVRDRSCLALAAGRMRQDPIFRDAVHHFLRQFDTTFAGFEPTASDPDIAAFAETRTARAFMLLGRVTGTFD